MPLCVHHDVIPSPCYYDHNIINDDYITLVQCYHVILWDTVKCHLKALGLYNFVKVFGMASKICFNKEALFQLIWCKFCKELLCDVLIYGRGYNQNNNRPITGWVITGILRYFLNILF